MAGLNEILILVILAGIILMLPRFFKKAPSPKKKSIKDRFQLSVRNRIIVVLSLVWPGVAALYFQPWKVNYIGFITFGVIPVILVWAVRWILAGKKKTKG